MIDEFDYNILKNKPFNMAIIGKTGSGKTMFLKNLLLNLGYGYFKFIYMITHSEKTFRENEYYKYIFPNHVLYLKDYQDKKNRIVYNFLNKIDNFSYENKEEFSNCNTLIIYDDVGKETKEKLCNFTNECRHANISNIFLVHRLEHIDKSTRDSIYFHVINEANVELEYLNVNRQIKEDLSISINKAYREYPNTKGLNLIIYDSKLYSIIIDENSIKQINANDLYVFFTESSIKDDLLKSFEYILPKII
jgi:hypothetical protein